MVFGSYGTFGARSLVPCGAALWVAGGIGVTPFLSLLRHVVEGKATHTGEIQFVWAVRDRADAIYHEEIHALVARLPNVRFHLHVTATDGPLTVAHLEALAGAWVRGYRVLLCGPPPMMRALTTQLVSHGVWRSQIVSEEFALR